MNSPIDPKISDPKSADPGQASTLLLAEAARHKRKATINLTAMGLITVGLCFGGWYSMRQPNNRNQNKARLTAQYYLEALGQAPINKLGKELYPDLRRSLNPESYQAYLKQIELNQNLKTLSWDLIPTDPKIQQWNWLVKVQPETGEAFPLITMVRLPEEMSLSKRWHVYRLCRLDQDLRREAQSFIAAQVQAAETATVDLGQFKPVPAAEWQIDTDKMQITIPDQSQSQSRLTLRWEVMAGKSGPGCSYRLRGGLPVTVPG